MYTKSKEWLKRQHRTDAEKRAYLEGIDDVGIAESMYTAIYDLFFHGIDIESE